MCCIQYFAAVYFIRMLAFASYSFVRVGNARIFRETTTSDIYTRDFNEVSIAVERTVSYDN